MAKESWFFRVRRGLPPELQQAQEDIQAIARGYGLDFFDTIFEMCTYDEINMIASYGGFPTRYPHWRFGMEYQRMQRGYEYGLHKIYEMVINTNPSYAYLLDNNTFMDQKLVMAHVLGHVDFFKNNLWFAHTNRKMLDQMANHASRVRRIIDRQGVSAVEQHIDMCLSIENLIDPYAPHIRRQRSRDQAEIDRAMLHDGVHKLPARSYMDKYINPPEYLESQRQRHQAGLDKMARFPEEPERDVMGFILRHGHMPRWRQAILGMIHQEAEYFAPQGMTKVMNEGWACFWHTTMMTHDILDDSEVIDYADHHSGTVAMGPGNFNPYKVGIELFRDIERRWDRGQFGKEWLDCTDEVQKRDWDTHAGLGRQKVFEVRRTHNDITFIDTFLTPDFVRDQGLFTYDYDKASGKYIISSHDFHAVKQKLLFMLSSRGSPRITVTDGNHANRGELELTHAHEGVDIQLDWARETMANLAALWGRPVHLISKVDDKRVLLHHDGDEFKLETPDK